MDGKERVVKHLEMTQGIIRRLGGNAFRLKGWSMAALVATMVLISRQDTPNPYLALTLLAPVLGFWILDGYFLWQERLFRQVYEDVRKKDDTDFQMDVVKHRNAPGCTWRQSMFSVTLVIFYAIEVAFTLLVFAVMSCQ